MDPHATVVVKEDVMRQVEAAIKPAQHRLAELERKLHENGYGEFSGIVNGARLMLETATSDVADRLYP